VSRREVREVDGVGCAWKGVRSSEVRGGNEDKAGLAMDCYETGTIAVNGSVAGIAQGQLSGGRSRRVLGRSGDAAGAERERERAKSSELQRATTGWIDDWKRMPRCDRNMVWDRVGVWRVVTGQCYGSDGVGLDFAPTL